MWKESFLDLAIFKTRAGPENLASDLASFEAGSADVLTFGRATHDGAHALNIWIPTSSGLDLGV